MTTNTKEWFQYGTAALMILSGVILTFISFFVNGDVSEGVLWYMAQSLTYAGAIFGVSVYFHQKIGETRNEIRNYIEQQLKQQDNECNKDVTTRLQERK